MQVLYTAHATATGGRDGRATSDDKHLDVPLNTPTELGGAGGAGHPDGRHLELEGDLLAQ